MARPGLQNAAASPATLPDAAPTPAATPTTSALPKGGASGSPPGIGPAGGVTSRRDPLVHSPYVAPRRFRVLKQASIVYDGGIQVISAGKEIVEGAADIEYLRRNGVNLEEIV